MSHPPLQRITAFEIVAPYTLRIRFSDHSEQTINFEPMLYGRIFGPLRDLNLFNQVRLDPEVHTLVWPNDADFDPTNLHNWPEDGPEFIKWARRFRTDTNSNKRPMPSIHTPAALPVMA